MSLGTYENPILVDDDDVAMTLSEPEEFMMIYLDQDEDTFWNLLHQLPTPLFNKICHDFFPRELQPDDVMMLFRMELANGCFYVQTRLDSSRPVGIEGGGLTLLTCEVQMFPDSAIPVGPWRTALEDQSPTRECYKVEPDFSGDLEEYLLRVSRHLIIEEFDNLQFMLRDPHIFPGLLVEFLLQNSPSGFKLANYLEHSIHLERYIVDHSIFDVDPDDNDDFQ